MVEIRTLRPTVKLHLPRQTAGYKPSRVKVVRRTQATQTFRPRRHTDPVSAVARARRVRMVTAGARWRVNADVDASLGDVTVGVGSPAGGLGGGAARLRQPVVLPRRPSVDRHGALRTTPI